MQQYPVLLHSTVGAHVKLLAGHVRILPIEIKSMTSLREVRNFLLLNLCIKLIHGGVYCQVL